ncbi:unnamed protein product [Moneuplotes crassus]|uniref:Uncharacterized protein n=1 Tax=Euplotes crassus TaxID=5936 RepID=A0AAD1UIE0_EUPCR|nr:unnamed protein product [Moneuplotes crassus]
MELNLHKDFQTVCTLLKHNLTQISDVRKEMSKLKSKLLVEGSQYSDNIDLFQRKLKFIKYHTLSILHLSTLDGKENTSPSKEVHSPQVFEGNQRIVSSRCQTPAIISVQTKTPMSKPKKRRMKDYLKSIDKLSEQENLDFSADDISEAAKFSNLGKLEIKEELEEENGKDTILEPINNQEEQKDNSSLEKISPSSNILGESENLIGSPDMDDTIQDLTLKKYCMMSDQKEKEKSNLKEALSSSKFKVYSSNLRGEPRCDLCFQDCEISKLLSICNGEHKAHPECFKKRMYSYIETLKHPTLCIINNCKKCLPTKAIESIANKEDLSFVAYMHIDVNNACKKARSIAWCNNCHILSVLDRHERKGKLCDTCLGGLIKVRDLFRNSIVIENNQKTEEVKNQIKEYVKIKFKKCDTCPDFPNPAISLQKKCDAHNKNVQISKFFKVST